MSDSELIEHLRASLSRAEADLAQESGTSMFLRRDLDEARAALAESEKLVERLREERDEAKARIEHDRDVYRTGLAVADARITSERAQHAAEMAAMLHEIHGNHFNDGPPGDCHACLRVLEKARASHRNDGARMGGERGES